MKKLNTTLIYVLSSISLLCCCIAGLGILLALPAYLIANKKLKEAEMNPEEYDPEEIKAMKTAKTFALVATIINGLNLVYSIYTLATTDMEVLKQQYQDALEKYQ
jgi:ABC-type sulfate transport system permease component